MHYLTAVFISPEESLGAAVDRALTPFDELRRVPPWKDHLHPRDVARMAAYFNLPADDLDQLAARMPEWNDCPGGVDRRGLYALRASNPQGRWDWYAIGGCWKGLVPGNRIQAAHLRRSPLLEELLPHDFVTPDGRWHSRERSVRGADSLVRVIRRRPASWRAAFCAALDASLDHLVVLVDCHH